MKRLIVVALATLLPATAMAYKHFEVGQNLFIVWSPDDMPIEYYVTQGDECAMALGEPLSAAADYCIDAAQLGWSAWNEAPCTEFTHQYMGPGDNRPQIPGDGYYSISFNDPANDIDDPATLATAACNDNGIRAFVQDGQNYNYINGCDIMFNDNTTFATHTSIAEGLCNGGNNMLETMTHEIGHTTGMGHSCDEGEVCNDPKLLEAVMYYTGGPCTASGESIKEDDIEGFSALYGPFATFTCSHELDPEDNNTIATGNVPFTVRCIVESDNVEEITSATWNWGDGGTTEGVRVEHEYTEPGNYNVQLEVNGDREECGEEGWEFNFRRVGYVRACGVPDAAFEIEQNTGLTYDLFNETDISIFGCTFNIEWEVYKGEGTGGELITTFASWEPSIEFPEAGTYTIVQNVGGPAGTGASMLTIDVKRGGGCSVVPVASGAVGLFALLPLAFARRRRNQ